MFILRNFLYFSLSLSLFSRYITLAKRNVNSRCSFFRFTTNFATMLQPQPATVNYVPLEHESEWVLAVVLFTFLESGWKVRNRVLSNKTIINTD